MAHRPLYPRVIDWFRSLPQSWRVLTERCRRAPAHSRPPLKLIPVPWVDNGPDDIHRQARAIRKTPCPNAPWCNDRGSGYYRGAAILSVLDEDSTLEDILFHMNEANEALKVP